MTASMVVQTMTPFWVVAATIQLLPVSAMTTYSPARELIALLVVREMTLTLLKIPQTKSSSLPAAARRTRSLLQTLISTSSLMPTSRKSFTLGLELKALRMMISFLVTTPQIPSPASLVMTRLTHGVEMILWMVGQAMTPWWAERETTPMLSIPLVILLWNPRIQAPTLLSLRFLSLSLRMSKT